MDSESSEYVEKGANSEIFCKMPFHTHDWTRSVLEWFRDKDHCPLTKKSLFLSGPLGIYKIILQKKNHRIETFIYSREPGVSFIENNPISKTGHARALWNHPPFYSGWRKYIYKVYTRGPAPVNPGINLSGFWIAYNHLQVIRILSVCQLSISVHWARRSLIQKLRPTLLYLWGINVTWR